MARSWQIGSFITHLGNNYLPIIEVLRVLFRNKFYKLGKRLAPILISVGEQDTAEIFTNSSELHISAVNKCLEFVTFLSIDVGFEEEITQAFDFLCDLALLHYNRDDKEWFNPIADLMDLLSDRKALKNSQLGYVKRFAGSDPRLNYFFVQLMQACV